MTEKSEPRFRVGDVVTVVHQPYLECPFSWVKGMDLYCGVTTKIIEVGWSYNHKHRAYRISADPVYKWCENCFEMPGFDAEIEESDVDISILFQ